MLTTPVQLFYIMLRCRYCRRDVTAEYYSEEERRMEDRQKGFLWVVCQNCNERSLPDGK